MRRAIVLCLGVVVAALSPLVLTPGSASADTDPGHLVRTVPVAGTPNVLDGRVNAIAQVGGTMILGGTFTQAQNADDTATTFTRNRLLAFDATTGQISTTFLPDPDGPIETVLPTGDGKTVWVGGDFRTIGGVARQNLARIRVSDGTVVASFNAGAVSGKVLDLKLSGGRLWVAGAFTNIANRNQGALATLNPSTGALVDFFRGTLDGAHAGGTTSVLKMDLTPAGDRLIAVGNFDTLDARQAPPDARARHLGRDRGGRGLQHDLLPPGLLRRRSTATCATSTSPRTGRSPSSAPPARTAARAARATAPPAGRPAAPAPTSARRG